VRVALINDGTYPYRAGVAATWTHRLVRGLPEHAFHFVTITDHTPVGALFYPPGNTLTMTSITLGGPGVGPTKRKAALAHRRAATHAAVLLCRSMLEDTPESVAMFRSALRRLALGASEKVHPLNGVPLAAVLFDAWKAAATARRDGLSRLPRTALTMPTVADANQAANLLERALRPLSTPLPLTELIHATDTGLAALVALGAKWRLRTPYVLTEHETYLTAPLLDHTAGNPAVRAVLLRFFRALARLAYQEAGVVAATTEPLRAWALEHGADRERLSLVPYGVDPHSCAVIRGEPADDIITWLGPERDLRTLLAALPAIKEAAPDIRVLVAGPAVPIQNRHHAEKLSFLGPVNHRRSAYANGKLVVLSGTDPTMPYALIEAMMCGRPTIVLDDTGLAKVFGMGAVVVPPNNPVALADACTKLLRDRDRRRQLSIAAGQRARSLFALRAKLDRFREIYERVVADTSAATQPLLSIPLTTSTMTMNLPPIQPTRGELAPVPPHPAVSPEVTGSADAIGLPDGTAGPAARAAGPEPDDDVEDLQYPITDVTPPVPAPPAVPTPIIGVPAATTRGQDGHDYWAVADDQHTPAEPLVSADT
jgi:glycosyltransferase involved in cell wall biosynthesis